MISCDPLGPQSPTLEAQTDDPTLVTPPDDLIADEQNLSDDEERVIRCAACEAELTRPRNRIERDGLHIHVFTNPHGYAFQIACFDEVPGAAATGEPSDEWAWFTGTHWRIAVCRACLSHVGWSFDTGESLFWGLITSKVQ